MENGELDGAVWPPSQTSPEYPPGTLLVPPTKLPSRNPSQGTCHGNMAAALIAVRVTLLSSAVVDVMDIYKSWACPWAPLIRLVAAFHDLHGEHNLIFQIRHGLRAPCTLSAPL